MGRTLSLPLKGKHIEQWGRRMCTQLTIIKYGERHNGDLPQVSWEHKVEWRPCLRGRQEKLHREVISELPLAE